MSDVDEDMVIDEPEGVAAAVGVTRGSMRDSGDEDDDDTASTAGVFPPASGVVYSI